MRVYVDATPLYNLGMIGELDLLAATADDLVIPETVRQEIDVEPAATNVRTLVDDASVDAPPALGDHRETARRMLGTAASTVDSTLVAGLLAERGTDDTPAAGLVSDDRRLRRLAEGLDTAVTSTFGVVVRAALEDKYFSTTQAKRVLRRMDNHGLVTTGPLRERAIGDVGG